MDYVKPELMTSYTSMDLYASASGFASVCTGDDNCAFDDGL